MEKQTPVRALFALSLLGLNSCAPNASISQNDIESGNPKIQTLSSGFLDLPQLPAEIVGPEVVDLAIPIAQVQEVAVAKDCITPFEGAVVTLEFNEQVFTRDGNPIEVNGSNIRHLGLDFAPIGDVGENTYPIVNICDGEFVLATEIPQGMGLSLGNIVIIKYFDGEEYYYAVYAHLGETFMEDHTPGDIIRKGEIIGTLGNSGGWAKKHLHLHIWRESAWERFVIQEGHNKYGLYPETWNEDLINEAFINPRVFMPDLP